MKHCLLPLLVALSLTLAACGGGQPAESSSCKEDVSGAFSALSESSSQVESPSRPESPSQEESSAPAFAALHTVEFFIAGSNAQGTEITLEVPGGWYAEGDRLVAPGLFTARFEIALPYDSTVLPPIRAVTSLEEGEGEDRQTASYSDNTEGHYYPARITLGNAAPVDGVRYYLANYNTIMTIALAPAGGTELETARQALESCLASLTVPVRENPDEAVYDWTDDPARIARLAELQRQEQLTDAEALELAACLAEKAYYLNYLAYGEDLPGVSDPETGERVRLGVSGASLPVPEPEHIRRYNEAQDCIETFVLVHHLPYENTAALRNAVESVFTGQAAAARMEHLFYRQEDGGARGLYTDLDGRLYLNGSVSGMARAFRWELDGAALSRPEEGRIEITAQVSLMESWQDTLRLVRQDGLWRLDDSYFAVQEAQQAEA